MTVPLARLEREVLEISGRDAFSFLEGQVSQSVQGLTDGVGAASFLLQPDGKVVDLIGVHRVGDVLLIDVDRAARELVEQRLRRFLFRVDVTIQASPLLALWWPEGTEVGAYASARWFGNVGRMTLNEIMADDLDFLQGVDLERQRILQEIPSYGREITDRTIPASLGGGLVASAVSFTKGCYTGQELVARLDARGSQVPFHLVGLTSQHEMHVGDALSGDGDGPNGVVTSVAPNADGTGFVGLGFAHRSQADLTSLLLPGGDVVAMRALSGDGVFQRP